MDDQGKGLGRPEDAGYFASYQDLEVHKLMLQDQARVLAYREAIARCGDSIRGKTCLDVGAGTGILSLFCIKAGAKKVYAVEASDLASALEEVVEANGGKGLVQVVKGRMEEVDIPEKVDVIVSEWMGFYLLHESMLDSVLFARDKYLKPGGTLLPSRASIHACPCSLQRPWEDQGRFWKDVHGLDLSAVWRAGLASKARKAPDVLQMEPEDMLASPVLVASLDLMSVTPRELDSIKSRHFLSLTKGGQFNGLALWFDCQFGDSGVTLSTSPWAAPTHWKQTVIVTSTGGPGSSDVEEDEVVGWEVSLVRNNEADRRRYEVHLKALDPLDDDHPAGCECQLAKCLLMQMLEREAAVQENCTS